MRLLLTTASIVLVAAQIAADQVVPRGRLFRGPFIGEREAILVAPDRPLPIEFDKPRLSMGAAAPWAAFGHARLHAHIRSNTLRAVSMTGIWLRVAAGPAEHGIYTFRMRGIPSVYAPEEFTRLPNDTLLRQATFAAVPDESYPGLLLINPQTKIVFTVERLYDDGGQIVFENPDAIELLWAALGRPTLSTP